MLLDSRHALALSHAAQRTDLIILEETYCLLGLAQSDGTYLILAVIKPRQRAAVHRWGQTIMSSVISRPCPVGTIADLHTHPFHSGYPSSIDDGGWKLNRRYTLHLIAFVVGPDKVGFTAHDYSNGTHRQLLDSDWLAIERRN